jgi:hypothetical protein
MPYATKEWENWGVGEWVSLFLKMTNPLLEAMRSKGIRPNYARTDYGSRGRISAPFYSVYRNPLIFSRINTIRRPAQCENREQ